MWLTLKFHKAQSQTQMSTLSMAQSNYEGKLWRRVNKKKTTTKNVFYWLFEDHLIFRCFRKSCNLIRFGEININNFFNGKHIFKWRKVDFCLSVPLIIVLWKSKSIRNIRGLFCTIGLLIFGHENNFHTSSWLISNQRPKYAPMLVALVLNKIISSHQYIAFYIMKV